MMRGHFAYYSVGGNIRRLRWFAHQVVPGRICRRSKGMVGFVVGLVASLLSLVLSLLIGTSHGLCTTQQSQLQTIGSSIIRLDLVLKAYGPEAELGRALLREHVKRMRAPVVQPE